MMPSSKNTDYRPKSRKPGLIDVVRSYTPVKIKILTTIFLWTFWILGTWCFVAQRIPGAFDALNTPMQILGDFIILLLGIFTIRSKWDYAVLISFIIISAISTLCINHLSIPFWINGSRFYFGILFLTPFFRWVFENRNRAIYFIHKFDKSLYIFLWIQFPCMIYQFVALGGIDQGGGSLGNYMSGIISTLIYFISLYLMLRRWDNQISYFKNLIKNWSLLFLLLPTFMNETKISFIYFILYFIFLIPFNKKFLQRIVITIPLILLIGFGAIRLYLRTTQTTDEMMSAEWLEYYVMGDDQTYDLMEVYLENEGSDEDRDFMRGAKFLMLPAVLIDKPWGTWVGYGVSQFKGLSVMDMTDFYRRYQWFLFGTTTLLIMILIDLGIVGTAWLLFAFLVMFGIFGSANRKINLQMYIFMILITFVTLFYASCITIPAFAMPCIYIIFCAQHRDLVTDTVNWEKSDNIPHNNNVNSMTSS
ncbi:MAG: hypothetical protein NC201_06380 [Prevotella sp.]|nr:hypothetical protein [Bacteroides sp.]MCM1366855.1 hypothetical protein [Prevotella sp.]MCM1437419.1 hypothetical protein [Prevotella sp.]